MKMLKEDVATKMASEFLPTLNLNNLEKIESFLNDSSYKEMIENSATYNTRLCIERRMRLPFLDNQTGVAQNHSNLYLLKRQRMPGLIPGQIYTYPRPRWRKKRRQYLLMNSRAFARTADSLLDDNDLHSLSQLENPSLQDTDSKDSQLLKDEASKDWYYDEQDMLEMDTYDEPDPDSDLDYEESCRKTKRRKGAGRGRGSTDSPSTPGRKKGSGRGRKKSGHVFEPVGGDPDKPFSCELCGARYKTRPGLTYHYTHSHKEGASDENSHDAVVSAPAVAASVAPLNSVAGAASMGGVGGGVAPPPPAGENSNNGAAAQGNNMGNVYQDSYVSFLTQPNAGNAVRRNNRPGAQASLGQQSSPQAPPNLPPNLPNQQPASSGDDPPMPVLVPEKTIEPPLPSQSSSVVVPPATTSVGPTTTDAPPKDKAAPSPYCDFCLGDARENKKTGGSEELVSCSDCGRSGHPSCLQFTPNMIISVKKYRWQCIECKCCSVCGTSDNDDQLLFCDDCDRGYHMYCLSPPLTTPPEGSWSCHLCIEHFHKQ